MEKKDFEFNFDINTELAKSNLEELKIWLDLIKEQLGKEKIGGQSFTELAKLAGKANEQVEKVQKAIEKLGETAPNMAGVQRLAGTLKELKTTVSDLEKEFEKLDINSEEFKKAAKEVGEYKRKLAETEKLVERYSKAAPKLDAFVTISSEITAGFTAAQGAAELFGLKAQGISAVIEKVSTANSILNSVLTVTNALQKDGAIAFAMSTTYQKANTLATKAAIVVQKLFGKSVDATKGSLKGLKAAIVSTGIGALIVGVGLLVDKIMDWADSSSKAKKAEEELQKQMEENNKSLNKYMESYKAGADMRNLATELMTDTMARERQKVWNTATDDINNKLAEIARNKHQNNMQMALRDEDYIKYVNKRTEVAKKDAQAIEDKYAKEDADKRKKDREDRKAENEKRIKENNDAFLKEQEEKLRILELSGKLTKEAEIKNLNEIKQRGLLTENEYKIKLLEIENKYIEKAKDNSDRYREIQNNNIEINQTFVNSQKKSARDFIKKHAKQL